jgi:CheY-like chemotaxis protein
MSSRKSERNIAESRQSTPDRKKVVLVADDSAALADVLVLVLTNNGFEAHAVYSGVRQVKLAKSLRPDFVISDIMRPEPDINGVDAAIEIRKAVPSCKILLLTASTGPLQLMLAGRQNYGRFADLILLKPLPYEKIIAWLRNGGHPSVADPVEVFCRLTGEEIAGEQ